MSAVSMLLLEEAQGNCRDNVVKSTPCSWVCVTRKGELRRASYAHAGAGQSALLLRDISHCMQALRAKQT